MDGHWLHLGDFFHRVRGLRQRQRKGFCRGHQPRFPIIVLYYRLGRAFTEYYVDALISPSLYMEIPWWLSPANGDVSEWLLNRQLRNCRMVWLFCPTPANLSSLTWDWGLILDLMVSLGPGHLRCGQRLISQMIDGWFLTTRSHQRWFLWQNE